MRDTGRIVNGLIGAVVAVVVIGFGLTWATRGIDLEQSVLLGAVLAVVGLLRLGDAARVLFRGVDGADAREDRTGSGSTGRA